MFCVVRVVWVESESRVRLGGHPIPTSDRSIDRYRPSSSSHPPSSSIHPSSIHLMMIHMNLTKKKIYRFRFIVKLSLGFMPFLVPFERDRFPHIAVHDSLHPLPCKSGCSTRPVCIYNEGTHCGDSLSTCNSLQPALGCDTNGSGGLRDQVHHPLDS